MIIVTFIVITAHLVRFVNDAKPFTIAELLKMFLQTSVQIVSFADILNYRIPF